MEKVLFDWPFKIIEEWRSWWLTFARIVFEWEEIYVKFKQSNVWKIIDCIREWFWNRSKLINPITNVPEERPLKQHLKYNWKLFYW